MNTRSKKIKYTHKNRTVSHYAIRKNKHWIYCLKTIKSEKFQDPPTSLLCGCHKWMTPKQFLTLKG